jgi:two-component system sensor histidine kinase PilS (NtrC family)
LPDRAEPAGTAPGERRRGDRRRSDRRQPQGRRREDSLFGALGGAPAEAADTRALFDPGWLSRGDPSALASDDDEVAEPPASLGAPSRVFRTYVAARAGIGVALVAVVGLGSLLAARSGEAVALLCLVYAVQAITLWLLPRFGPLAAPAGRARARRWLSTIGVDLLAYGALHLLTAGASLNYGALLVLPVLMAGVLTPRLLALGTASAVALLLLAAAWRSAAGQPDAPALMLQSGFAGLGLFAIALVAGELAARLAREEQAARGSLALARQQARLNRLVIEEMVDGVLVVDGQRRVRAANPAARALLVDQGLAPPAPFALAQRAAWADLVEAVGEALARGDWPEAGHEVTLHFESGQRRTLRMRVRFLRGRGRTLAGRLHDDETGEPLAVLLLEDVRTAQARLRQEKLAAMGRVSAGVAHEIRNPLAAIAQANALLQEDELNPAQRRLTTMVADNVARLNRLVEDVMEVAPGAAPASAAFDAVATVAAAADEWCGTAGLADGRLRSELPAQPLPVRFDPEHLRRVLVNLLDNALRHASSAPGAVFLRLAARDDSWAVLSVLSDSPPIPPDVERHLFEPFFSTRSRGSGLGLFICRELCERHGASIEYRPRPAAERLRNEFVVTLPRAPAAPTPWDRSA